MIVLQCYLTSRNGQKFLSQLTCRVNWVVGLMVGLLFIIGIGPSINPLLRGLTAAYYTNSEWQGDPLAVFTERAVTLRRMERVFPTTKTDYSIRWEGWIVIPKSGDYQFTLTSDDGSGLFIDGQLVVDNGGLHGKQERSGQRNLEKGNHAIRIDYMQGKTLAIFRAYWAPPGQSQQPLSQANFFVTAPGRKARLMGWMIETLTSLSRLLFLVCLALLVIPPLFKARTMAGTELPLLLLIFFFVVISHFFWSNITTAFDSKWSIHTALSLIKEGNTNLDEYAPLIRQYQDYSIEQRNGHTYPTYPLGNALLAVPYVWLIDAFLSSGFAIDFEPFINTYALWLSGIEKFVASNLVALTTVFIYLISKSLMQNRRKALLITFIFAFCTPAWSTASRALWQHGPTMLMLSCVLSLLLWVETHPEIASWAIPLLSVPLSFTYVIRPTNSLSIIALSLLIFMRYRRYFLAYCLWSLLIWVPFVLYNLQVYHALLAPYYLSRGQVGGLNVTFLEGLAGLLVSPSRGLLIFSPILLFALYGIGVTLKNKQRMGLDVALISIIVLHWIVSALHPHWWGGHSYGPRYFTDMLPYLMYFLSVAFRQIAISQHLRQIWLISLIAVVIVMSFFIHYRGATSQAVYGWNSGPVNVDEDPSRVWDWHDMQFLRGLYNL